MFGQNKYALVSIDANTWKKVLLAIVLLILCLAISACDPGNTKKAKEAYEAGNYSEVINVLESEPNLDEEAAGMLNASKAHVAFDAGNYSEVISVLESGQNLDEEAAGMLGISRAHVAFDAGNYLNAMTELLAVKNGKEMSLYLDAVESLVKKAVENSSEGELIEAIKLDPTVGDTAAKAIEERCEALDYGAFKFMDRMLEEMPESEGKVELQEYRDKNELSRPKAFLLGKWEWQSDDEVKTSVSCVEHKDNLIATVDVVGDADRDFKILKDDVYWKDFDFLEADRFTCMCLCKTGDGIGVECTTVGTINYKDDTLHLHLTAPDPYWMDEKSSDRDWKRIPK